MWYNSDQLAYWPYHSTILWNLQFPVPWTLIYCVFEGKVAKHILSIHVIPFKDNMISSPTMPFRHAECKHVQWINLKDPIYTNFVCKFWTEMNDYIVMVSWIIDLKQAADTPLIGVWSQVPRELVIGNVYFSNIFLNESLKAVNQSYGRPCVIHLLLMGSATENHKMEVCKLKSHITKHIFYVRLSVMKLTLYNSSYNTFIIVHSAVQFIHRLHTTCLLEQKAQ